jgi:hypothetical protein
MEVPRYYIPLTAKGGIALRLRLYRKPVELLPSFLLNNLLKARAKFYSVKYSRDYNAFQ